jgi:hypothetical protein
MLKTQEYVEELSVIDGVAIKIASYRVGDLYHCHIDNVDVGATIARAEGTTRVQAKNNALAVAKEHLQSGK